MCGRYRLSRRKQLVEEYFDSAPWEEEWSPRHNIAPTQPVPVVRQNPKEPVRQLSLERQKFAMMSNPPKTKMSIGEAYIFLFILFWRGRKQMTKKNIRSVLTLRIHEKGKARVLVKTVTVQQQRRDPARVVFSS
jgi:putative SOS response-associated peptidase YedK